MATSVRHTVFIVDDDEAVRKSLAFLIESEGLVPRTFGTAKEFLDTYERSHGCCLVLDVHMPGIDGFKLLEMIGAPEPPLPVIIISARADETTRATAKRLGAFQFLEKPVDDEALLHDIRRACDGHCSEDD